MTMPSDHKHSPGPWTWREGAFYPKQRPYRTLEDANGKPLFYESSRTYVPVSDANARLIAEAPAVLELLKRLEFNYGATWEAEHCGAYEALLARIRGDELPCRHFSTEYRSIPCPDNRPGCLVYHCATYCRDCGKRI